MYVQMPDGRETIVLYRRQKGAVGQSLKALAYVRAVDLAEAGGKAEAIKRP